MYKFRIEQVIGEEAKPAIDEFYKKNGSKGTARKDDLFFVAYSENKIVGCVRFCVEEGTSMLRTMYVDSSYRKQGVGRILLEAFAKYLEKSDVRNVFCLPYTHLENFYGFINFMVVPTKEVPQFLIDRSTTYAKNGTNTLYMRPS